MYIKVKYQISKATHAVSQQIFIIPLSPVHSVFVIFFFIYCFFLAVSHLKKNKIKKLHRA